MNFIQLLYLKNANFYKLINNLQICLYIYHMIFFFDLRSLTINDSKILYLKRNYTVKFVNQRIGMRNMMYWIHPNFKVSMTPGM